MHSLVATGLIPLGHLPGVHAGQALPAARVVVLAVPALAAVFYFAVVRRRRNR
ncbi:MAG TPA: hypothetical protein VFN59_02235 [Acidimicrobiales bacterium]|nr:hypothetical protein [Acidimicrobiales bacterium]